MFVSTKTNVKLANENTGHSQLIGIILCCFPNCSIIYPVGPFYYCLDNPSNTILSDALIFYVGSKKVTSEPIEHCDFVDPEGCHWRSPYQTQNNLEFLKIDILKVNTQRNSDIVVPTVCDLSKQNPAQIIPHHFGHVSIDRLKQMTGTGLVEGLPTNLHYL